MLSVSLYVVAIALPVLSLLAFALWAMDTFPVKED